MPSTAPVLPSVTVGVEQDPQPYEEYEKVSHALKCMRNELANK